MKKQSCLNCKHVSYVIENKKDPNLAIFYCTFWLKMYEEATPCENYQENSSEEE